MAQLMNSLVNLDNKVRRHFKRALEALDEQFIVRSPILDNDKVAQIVIEGANNTWLFVGYHLAAPTKVELQAFVDFVIESHNGEWRQLNYLAIIEKPADLNDHPHQLIQGVHHVDKADFLNDTQTIVDKHLVQLSHVSHQQLKIRLFSESSIHAACTTRQSLQRDNSAQLQHVFLDYDQEWAAKLDIIDDERNLDTKQDFTLRLINGVAGSGKTLILINRALLYCRKYPTKKILFLIHNKPITTDIKLRLDRYLGGKPDNLNLQTFHAFARAQKLKASNAKTKINIIFSSDSPPVQLQDLFSEKSETIQQTKLSATQLWSEIEYINAHLIANENDYLTVERHGRGFALQQNQRKLIWQLYTLIMQRLCSYDKGYLASLYIREMCLNHDTENSLDKYHHILLDEAQFFLPSWLELVKKSILPNGQLFMCADPNQGFLKSRLSWKSIGLNVRGRTKILTYSYRTTYSILKAANALLDVFKEDPEEFLKPEFDKMEIGSQPQVIFSATPQDELSRFLNELDSCVHQMGVPLNQILILCGETYKPWDLKKQIENRIKNVNVLNYNDSNAFAKPDSIKLMTINSCTGMEAGVVFILGIGELLSKSNTLDMSEEEKQIAKQETYRKLYVAMTRAGQKLFMFSTDDVPEEIIPFVECKNSQLQQSNMTEEIL